MRLPSLLSHLCSLSNCPPQLQWQHILPRINLLFWIAELVEPYFSNVSVLTTWPVTSQIWECFLALCVYCSLFSPSYSRVGNFGLRDLRINKAQLLCSHIRKQASGTVSSHDWKIILSRGNLWSCDQFSILPHYNPSRNCNCIVIDLSVGIRANKIVAGAQASTRTVQRIFRICFIQVFTEYSHFGNGSRSTVFCCICMEISCLSPVPWPL